MNLPNSSRFPSCLPPKPGPSAIKLRFLLVVIAMGLLTSAYVRRPPEDAMVTAANNFLNSLGPERAARASFPFGDEERFNWHFVPRERAGIPFREMAPQQKHLAHALLSAGLSRSGYAKATTIMSLEEVLRVLESDSGERRSPEKYYFSIFGRPGEAGPWGYRVEGHHVSLNFTVVDGRVAASPNFFGANPAEVRNALDADQRRIAVVSEKAYRDILTANSRKAALEGHPSGLPAAKMSARQRLMLEAVVREYAENLPEPVAQARMELLRKAGANLHFAWAGTGERGGPHYYRVQSPDFLIEYDNTQNGANHIHSVWREFRGDFGLDLLKEHYAESRHP